MVLFYLFFHLESLILVSSTCFYCNVLSAHYILYILHSDNETYEIDGYDSPSPTCSYPINTMGSCPQNSTLCSSGIIFQQSGHVTVSRLPYKNICSWVLNLTGYSMSYSEFRIQSTGLGYVMLTYSTPPMGNIQTEYNYLSASADLELVCQGTYFEIILYSYSQDPIISVQFIWNPTAGSQSQNTITILSIGCSAFALLLIIVFTCVYYQRLKKYREIHAQRSFQYIQADSSLNSFIENIVPAVFAQSDQPDPCCICFDLINQGCFFRILPCSHYFHSNCIEEWIIEKKSETACPLCMKPIF